MGRRLGFDPILADLAISIVTGVPNSAGLERLFLTIGMVYRKLRRNLDVEKCGKRVFISLNELIFKNFLRFINKTCIIDVLK